MKKRSIICALSVGFLLIGCAMSGSGVLSEVQLSEGFDESAGGDAAYIVTTPLATYYLEKEGGGLSSMIDADGIDWIGFHKEPGSGHKGEYRGFPNAVHKQDGSYFHAMNAGTDASFSQVEVVEPDHVRIVVTSGNGQWKGQYDFFSDRLDFTMRKVSSGYKYWVQYEGVPGGEIDENDYWMSSADMQKHPIVEHSVMDLPSLEWMAFGDEKSPRVLYVFHHEDDEYPDDYVDREHMTVLGFGRRDKEKFLTTPQTFSIGFIESTDGVEVNQHISNILK